MNESSGNAAGPVVAWFATKGSKTNEARRMAALLALVPNIWELPFDKLRKRESALKLLRLLHQRRPALLVMEGTGVAGGLVCLLAKILWKIPYVFSSGDAVGPFVHSVSAAFGMIFEVYERILCRCSAGFIGWSPYLTGRALTFGAPRGITAAGWPIGQSRGTLSAESRSAWRRRWGIPEHALVIGLIGSLVWNPRRRYCYGWDLVTAATRLRRSDLMVVVVGEGDGLERLKAAAGEYLGSRVCLPGPVALEEVMLCLSAFDVGALPQSTDGVGAFRYTTKLSEYAAAGLPVITSRIPAAYDLGMKWMWRLRGRGPWEETYVAALTELLEHLDEGEIAAKREAIPKDWEVFDREAQIARVAAFIDDTLEELGCRPGQKKIT